MAAPKRRFRITNAVLYNTPTSAIPRKFLPHFRIRTTAYQVDSSMSRLSHISVCTRFTKFIQLVESGVSVSLDYTIQFCRCSARIPEPPPIEIGAEPLHVPLYLHLLWDLLFHRKRFHKNRDVLPPAGGGFHNDAKIGRASLWND